MNYIYRLLSVIFISVVLLGCLENEELNLTPYPTDSSIAIIKPKDSANDTIYATYGTSGELKLSSPIERVYTIQLDKPLLQDMEIDLEIQSLNIPSECIDLSVYLANLHTSFLCNLIYPTFSRILLYSC